MIKITLFERLMTPKAVCKSSKGLVSKENKVIGAYLYNSRGVSPRNMVVGAQIIEQKNLIASRDS